MSKPYSEAELSNQLDADFVWRIREFSDLKDAVRRSEFTARPVLLRALVSMLYAHWEGYIKFCAEKYFSYITLRRHRFHELEDQIYVNYFLTRIDAMPLQRVNLRDRCRLVADIMGSRDNRFSRVNPSLIDTGSNLNSRVLQEICTVCAIDFDLFETETDFIDRILVKRRNEIAHGESTFIEVTEMDDLVSVAVGLMRSFRNALENKIYSRSYRAA